MVDSAIAEFIREVKEILRKHGHGRGIEQVLETRAQTEFEDVANAERIDLTDGEIGRREIDCSRKVIDGVDPLAEIVEIRVAQTEPGLANVTGHHADARRERLIPDFNLLQDGAQALEFMLDVVGLHQAMYDQIGILLQKIVQKKTTDEAGRPGQQNLLKSSRRHGIGR